MPVERAYDLGIKNKLTACKVDRDGLISGAEDVSQVSRCRMNCLSIAVFVSALHAPTPRKSVSMSCLEPSQDLAYHFHRRTDIVQLELLPQRDLYL